MTAPHKNIGASFDDFLKEEGIFSDVESAAWKRVIAFQIAEEMKRQQMTKAAMARRMGTSRAAIHRMLDPVNPSVTLKTLGAAATILGRRLRVELA